MTDITPMTIINSTILKPCFLRFFLFIEKLICRMHLKDLVPGD
jgi:hypothetical protein